MLLEKKHIATMTSDMKNIEMGLWKTLFLLIINLMDGY
jgi:hypothetical protein